MLKIEQKADKSNLNHDIRGNIRRAPLPVITCRKKPLAPQLGKDRDQNLCYFYTHVYGFGAKHLNIGGWRSLMFSFVKTRLLISDMNNNLLSSDEKGKFFQMPKIPRGRTFDVIS